jgi:hypothetical protein
MLTSLNVIIYLEKNHNFHLQMTCLQIKLIIIIEKTFTIKKKLLQATATVYQFSCKYKKKILLRRKTFIFEKDRDNEKKFKQELQEVLKFPIEIF